jgi:WD40 repeat protein
MRLNQGKNGLESTLTIRKKMIGHSNICSSIKFNPLNDYELFSGSFDCSILIWDIRSAKTYSNKIITSDILLEINKNEENNLVSSMTPSFVHSLHFVNVSNENILLAGIENGLCLAFKTNLFKFVSSEQLQPFNCALTQLNDFILNDKMKLEAVTTTSTTTSNAYNNEKVLSGCGNGRTIEFFYLNNDIKIQKFEKFKIDHTYKINSAKSFNNKLFIADTSYNLTIYDFNT